MNKIVFMFTLFVLSITAVGFADQSEQVITLKDGSQIKGELAGIEKGIYTVKTPIIGDVHVAASDVASITNGNAPVAALPTNNANSPTVPNQSSASIPNMDQQIAASQKQLMSNPQTMATLQEMMQDPEIMQALQDPALVQAVTSHDYAAVQSNPQIQKLISTPKMQELLQKLAAQQQQQQQNTSSQ
jgi:hypothetical protein